MYPLELMQVQSTSATKSAGSKKTTAARATRGLREPSVEFDIGGPEAAVGTQVAPADEPSAVPATAGRRFRGQRIDYKQLAQEC